MRGVSEVIAIILILMITISLAGLAYMFMSTTMSDVTSSAGSTVDTTTSSMLTSFTIESMDIAKVYIRNTGQSALTSLSVYVNDEPAIYNVTTPIAAGAVGTITIYSFIPDGATVKVTSPNGFSTSKVAHPCEKAVGCWDFDEASGTTAYDSSPYGNTGTLINGPTWTNGKYGNAIRFDGSNDYVNIGNMSIFNQSREITIEAWIYPLDVSTNIAIAGKDYSYFMRENGNSLQIWYYNNTGALNYVAASTLYVNRWFHIVSTINVSGNVSLYMDGIRKNTQPFLGTSIASSTGPVTIGINAVAGAYFNGTVDEVRIYNRAIY